MRRIEGTVRLGFRCDATGCNENALWAPIICTPYRDLPKGPILTFTDIHVCHHHWDRVTREICTDHMREAIRAIANESRGNPDFGRQFLSRIGVHDPDYHQFQIAAGLIPADDQLVKSVIEMPKSPLT
jgi:hypothetical protein